MSTQEARLACRLILERHPGGVVLNWQTVNPATPDAAVVAARAAAARAGQRPHPYSER